MTRDLVVDASVSAFLVLTDERSELSERILDHVLTGNLRVAVPELWHYEMLNVLRTAVARERISEQEAWKALERVSSMPVESVPAESQGLPAILACALRHGLSVYDATYVELARSRGIDLVSGDQHLLSLRGEFPWIWSAEQFCASELGDRAEP